MSKTNLIAEPGKQVIVMTREFDAPRDLVFSVWTDPKRIPEWWGPRTLTTVVDKMEVRAGGQWRYVQRDAQGNQFAFRGVYHDIIAPERIISTFEFEGLPGHVLLETATFEALPNGTTRVTGVSIFESVADRDGMVASGMEAGAVDTYERFAEILKSL